MTALTHCKEWNLGNTVGSLRKAGHIIKRAGFNATLKYVLYDKETGKPISSRFIKSKSNS